MRIRGEPRKPSEDASEEQHTRREKARELGKLLEPKLKDVTMQIEQKINHHFSLYEGIQEQNQMAELVSRFRGYVKNLGQAGKIVAAIRLQSAIDTFNEISGREQKIYDSLSATVQPILDLYIEHKDRTTLDSVERREVDQSFEMVADQMHEIVRHIVQKRLYAATDLKGGYEALSLELEREMDRSQ